MSEIFQRKADATDRTKTIAKNKRSTLKIYKKDSNLQNKM